MTAQTDAGELVTRVRVALATELSTERRMFGGTAFMLGGNMLCCASRKGLMVRVGREQEAIALARPFAGPCLGTGRPMAGFIMVEPSGVADDQSVGAWLDLARAYVAKLPVKSEAKTQPRAAAAKSKPGT